MGNYRLGQAYLNLEDYGQALAALDRALGTTAPDPVRGGRYRGLLSPGTSPSASSFVAPCSSRVLAHRFGLPRRRARGGDSEMTATLYVRTTDGWETEHPDAENVRIDVDELVYQRS